MKEGETAAVSRCAVIVVMLEYCCTELGVVGYTESHVPVVVYVQPIVVNAVSRGGRVVYDSVVNGTKVAVLIV